MRLRKLILASRRLLGPGAAGAGRPALVAAVVFGVAIAVILVPTPLSRSLDGERHQSGDDKAPGSFGTTTAGRGLKGIEGASHGTGDEGAPGADPAGPGPDPGPGGDAGLLPGVGGTDSEHLLPPWPLTDVLAMAENATVDQAGQN